MHLSARNTCKRTSKSGGTQFFHFSVAFWGNILILAADGSKQRQSSTVLLDGWEGTTGKDLSKSWVTVKAQASSVRWQEDITKDKELVWVKCRFLDMLRSPFYSTTPDSASCLCPVVSQGPVREAGWRRPKAPTWPVVGLVILVCVFKKLRERSHLSREAVQQSKVSFISLIRNVSFF